MADPNLSPDTPVVFGVRNAQRIAEATKIVERKFRNEPAERPMRPGAGVRLKHAKTGAGGIGARSGSTPGSGSVTLQDFVGGSFTPGDTVTAYNAMGTAIGANHYILLAWVGGFPFVVNEDC